MTARFCPFCGQPTVPKGTFCASCGASLGESTSPSGRAEDREGSIPQVTPILQFPHASALDGGLPTDARSADLDALTNVGNAAVLSLLGVLVGLALLLSLSGTNLLTLGALLVVSAILTLLELMFFRRAFTALGEHDPGFSNPARWVQVLLVTFPVLLVTLFAFGWLVAQASSCGGGSGVFLPPCTYQGAAVIIMAAVGIAGLVALIGFIGLLIGIWRLGTRYNAAGFKVG